MQFGQWGTRFNGFASATSARGRPRRPHHDNSAAQAPRERRQLPKDRRTQVFNAREDTAARVAWDMASGVLITTPLRPPSPQCTAVWARWHCRRSAGTPRLR